MANYRGVKNYETACRQQRKPCRPMTYESFPQHYLMARLYLKFLLISEHEVPFMNISEATEMVE